jgi:membrane protease YdiL (CAAX protease family)
MRLKSSPSFLLHVLKLGLLFYPLLVGGLWIWTPLGFWGSAYLAFLMELLPVLGLAQLSMADDDEPLPRVSVYLSSGALILALGFLALVVGTGEVGKEAMGLGATAPGPTLAWAVLSTLGILLILIAFYFGRRVLGLKESRILERLLPETWGERLLFALLSFSAGVGEELAFRGFALPALALATGSLWGGAVLSSFAFGLLHGYQGWLGVARTALMGWVMAASFILSGSLWPAIIAHTALDLISGLVLGRALLNES